MRVKLSGRARWAVPAAAVAVTGAAIAVSVITTAQAARTLPARTPGQLLAEVRSDATLPPLTGTVVETSSLGLPQLSQAADPTSLSSLITGSHTVNLYYENLQHFRVQVPQPTSEMDEIRDGNTLWQWNSTPDAVTKYTWPKGVAEPSRQPFNDHSQTGPVLIPEQAANDVLSAVGKTTAVSVRSNVLVAGEPAYQLVLAPKDKRSLVGKVVIAIDGKYGVPVRVQVFAKGGASPAFQVGFTQIAFVTPAAANLHFIPPPGAKVTKVSLSSDRSGHSGQAGDSGNQAMSGIGTYGSGWLTVVKVPQTQGMLRALMLAAKPVHGSWGSGTLLTTRLMSMLITRGDIYIGAVEPGVLYAAVGHAS